MSARAQAAWLEDGARLHLHHGPIDLIIGADAEDRDACFMQAFQRFETILEELSAEVPALKEQVTGRGFDGAVARQMQAAVWPHRAGFVTPMAAVAGAVADTVLAALTAGQRVRRAYVNNGGDIAFYLAEDAQFSALGPAGEITFQARDPARGLATSGWRGRSFSLGIADAVSVVAKTAAVADVAATLIANQVDLPGHSAVQRESANAVSPDSDLGARLVTVDVGPLRADEVELALQRGATAAQDMRDKGLILDAILSLQGRVCGVKQPELEGLMDA